MGMSITLLFNAISTYTGVVKNSWMVSANRARTTKTFFAIWLLALLLATLLTVEHIYFDLSNPVPSLEHFHMRVVHFLSKSADQSASTVRRIASTQTMEKAIMIVKLSVICYTCVIVMGM